uniref:VP2 n=1 Tax=viral metagenome TaxID=1070528 RepID=A0A2V0RA45_9ZZZZ
MPSRRTKRKSIAHKESQEAVESKDGAGKVAEVPGGGSGAKAKPVGDGKSINIAAAAHSVRFPAKEVDVEMEKEPVPKVPPIEQGARGPTAEGFRTGIATRRGLDNMANTKADDDAQPNTSNLQIMIDSTYKERIQQLSHNRALLEKDEIGPEVLIKANYVSSTLEELETLSDAVIEASVSEPTTVTFDKHITYNKLSLPAPNLDFLVSEDHASIIVKETLPHITVDMNVDLAMQIRAVATQLVDQTLLTPCVWAPAIESEIPFETSDVLVANEGVSIESIIRVERSRRRATGDGGSLMGEEFIRYKTTPHILSHQDGSSTTIRIDGLIRNDMHNRITEQWMPGVKNLAEVQALLLSKVPAGYRFPTLTSQERKWYYTYHDDHPVSIGAIFDALPSECSEYYRNVYLQALSGLRMVVNNVQPMARMFSTTAGISMTSTTSGSMLTTALTEKQDVLGVLQTLMMCSVFNNYRITFPEPRTTTVVEAVAACLVLLTFSTNSIDDQTHRILIGHIHSFIVGSVNRRLPMRQMVNDLENRRWPIIHPRPPFEFVAEGISPMLDDNNEAVINAVFNLDPSNARCDVEELVHMVYNVRSADFAESAKFKIALAQYLTLYCYAMADTSLSMHRWAIDFRLSVPTELREKFRSELDPVMISPKKMLSFTSQLSELVYDDTSTLDLTEFANARNHEFLELDKDIQQTLCVIQATELVTSNVRTSTTKKLMAVDRFISTYMPKLSNAMKNILTLASHSTDIKSGYKALVRALAGMSGPNLELELRKNPMNRIHQEIVANVLDNLEAYGVTEHVLICRQGKANRLPAGLFATDINHLLYKSPFLSRIPEDIDGTPLHRLRYSDCLIHGFTTLAKEGAFILDARCNFEYDIMTEHSAVTSHDHNIEAQSSGFKLMRLKWSIGMSSINPDENRDNISMMNSNLFAYVLKPQNLTPWDDILALEATTRHMPSEVVPYGKPLTATLIT